MADPADHKTKQTHYKAPAYAKRDSGRPTRRAKATDRLNDVMTVAIVVFLVALLGLGVRVYLSKQQRTHNAALGSSAPTTTKPPPNEIIPDNGTYPVGTFEGKSFGLWESAPAPTDCIWSIVVQEPDAATVTLDHGTTAQGETARVNVQLAGHEPLFFITSGCGEWHLVHQDTPS